MHLRVSRQLSLAIVLLALCGAAVPHPGRAAEKRAHLQVIVPEEDRFTPFAQTIHVGDSVKWINMDSDDHTVVSDDFFNTAGHQGLNVLLKGTENNGGKPGVFTLRFNLAGTFVYYCVTVRPTTGGPAAPQISGASQRGARSLRGQFRPRCRPGRPGRLSRLSV